MQLYGSQLGGIVFASGLLFNKGVVVASFTSGLYAIFHPFGDYMPEGLLPDHAVALGAVIVVASGMFLLWREMRTKVSSKV